MKKVEEMRGHSTRLIRSNQSGHRGGYSEVLPTAPPFLISQGRIRRRGGGAEGDFLFITSTTSIFYWKVLGVLRGLRMLGYSDC